MNNRNTLTLSILIPLSLFISSCSDDDPLIVEPEIPTTAEVLLSLATSTGMTGDPTTGRTLPSIDGSVAQLGKQLFFTKGLGGDNDSAQAQFFCPRLQHNRIGDTNELMCLCMLHILNNKIRSNSCGFTWCYYDTHLN